MLPHPPPGTGHRTWTILPLTHVVYSYLMERGWLTPTPPPPPLHPAGVMPCPGNARGGPPPTSACAIACVRLDPQAALSPHTCCHGPLRNHILAVPARNSGPHCLPHCLPIVGLMLTLYPPTSIPCRRHACPSDGTRTPPPHTCAPSQCVPKPSPPLSALNPTTHAVSK